MRNQSLLKKKNIMNSHRPQAIKEKTSTCLTWPEYNHDWQRFVRWNSELAVQLLKTQMISVWIGEQNDAAWAAYSWSRLKRVRLLTSVLLWAVFISKDESLGRWWFRSSKIDNISRLLWNNIYEFLINISFDQISTSSNPNLFK